ncbi:hypothetical protein IWQ56_004676, partial [Coemansia nantahalensis]
MSWWVGAGDAPHIRTINPKDVSEQREAEAARVVERSTFHDVPQVLALAKPRDADARRVAKTAVEGICKKLEADLEVRAMQADAELPGLVLKDLHARLQTATNAKGGAALAQIARQWVSNFTGFMGHGERATVREPYMYPPAMAFIMYVQAQIKRLYKPAGAQTMQTRHAAGQPRAARFSPLRLLLPPSATDFTPGGFDTKIRIDIALADSPIGGKPKLQSETHTRAFYAIVECKVSPSEYAKSLRQLSVYTRHVYQVQHNRVFAWALSVCGTLVYAVVMLHDAV